MTYLMDHQRNHRSYELVTVMFLWVFYYFSGVSKSLVMMFQRNSVISRRKISVTLLKQKILRIGKHIIESCRKFEPNWVPRASQVGGMIIVVGDQDYSQSEEEDLPFQGYAPTIGQECSIRIVKLNRVGAKRIELAAAKPIDIDAVLSWIPKLKDDFMTRALGFLFPSRLANLGHSQAADAKLCFLILEVIWMLKIDKVETRFGRTVHGVERSSLRIVCRHKQSLVLILYIGHNENRRQGLIVSILFNVQGYGDGDSHVGWQPSWGGEIPAPWTCSDLGKARHFSADTRDQTMCVCVCASKTVATDVNHQDSNVRYLDGGCNSETRLMRFRTAYAN